MDNNRDRQYVDFLAYNPETQTTDFSTLNYMMEQMKVEEEEVPKCYVCSMPEEGKTITRFPCGHMLHFDCGRSIIESWDGQCSVCANPSPEDGKEIHIPIDHGNDPSVREYLEAHFGSHKDDYASEEEEEDSDGELEEDMTYEDKYGLDFTQKMSLLSMRDSVKREHPKIDLEYLRSNQRGMRSLYNASVGLKQLYYGLGLTKWEDLIGLGFMAEYFEFYDIDKVIKLYSLKWEDISGLDIQMRDITTKYKGSARTLSDLGLDVDRLIKTGMTAEKMPLLGISFRHWNTKLGLTKKHVLALNISHSAMRWVFKWNPLHIATRLGLSPLEMKALGYDEVSIENVKKYRAMKFTTLKKIK